MDEFDLTIPARTAAASDPPIAYAALCDGVHGLCRAVALHHDGTPLESIVPVIVPAGQRAALGWFAARRWKLGDRPVHELALVAEHLDRGVEDVATTVIHELVHAYAHAADIKDVSRQGRYHNERFRDLAREFELETSDKPGTNGYRTVGLTDTARQRYANELRVLEEALVLVRLSRMKLVGGRSVRRPRRVNVMGICECERELRMSPESWELGPVICAVCAQPFLRLYG